MSVYGQVTVKNGKYKIKGDFHQMTPNIPIRNEDTEWSLMGVTNPRSVTHIHMYGGEAIFFENLGKGKIYGTQCDNKDCEFKGTVYLPFRIHCPDCLCKNSIIDLTNICKTTAKIHTFMVCERSGAFNTLETPIKFINVEFEGVSTILMSYLSEGEPNIGMRVIPIFRTQASTCTILDLSWVAEGTPENVLPEGFAFG
ncbi:Zn-ribbon domain-containing OB-fold protein [Thermodesulfobacteriota bacterium]